MSNLGVINPTEVPRIQEGMSDPTKVDWSLPGTGDQILAEYKALQKRLGEIYAAKVRPLMSDGPSTPTGINTSIAPVEETPEESESDQ
jgi:hypothetical protein